MRNNIGCHGGCEQAVLKWLIDRVAPLNRTVTRLVECTIGSTRFENG